MGPGGEGPARKGLRMRRLLTRTLLLACVLAAAIAAAFTQVASANYLGGVDVTCTSATYNYSTFPGGAQSVLETIFVDGAIVKQTTSDFTGPTGTDTLQFSVPNDGAAHTIEANAYSLTNSTPVFGLPGVVTLTCSSPPPPPPSSVCTYTQGYYKNHATDTTAAVVNKLGGTIKVGSMSLSADQALALLNSGGAQGNLALILARQLITAELNVARGSTASAGVQSAIASANAAITTSIVGGNVTVSSALSKASISTLIDTLDGFNSGSDCH
jgi:hypothetical protein